MKLGRSHFNLGSVLGRILSRVLRLSELRASCPEMFDPSSALTAVEAAIADEQAS